MKRELMRVAGVAALSLVPAFASSVTYTTTGTFADSSTTLATYTLASGTYLNFVGKDVPQETAYNAITNPQGCVTGTFCSVGPITASGSGTIPIGHLIISGTGSATGVSEGFTLTLTQTAPPAGSGTFSSSVSGTITNTSGGLLLTISGGGAGVTAAIDPGDFAQAYSVTLGGVIYYVDKYTSVPYSGSNSFATIQGYVDMSALPEPTFYSLTGLGFFGLLFMAHKRRRQATSV